MKGNPRKIGENPKSLLPLQPGQGACGWNRSRKDTFNNIRFGISALKLSFVHFINELESGNKVNV